MTKVRRLTGLGGLLLLLLSLVYPSPVLADAVPEGLTLNTEVGGLYVELVFPLDKVDPGETSFFVRITDAQGLPVEGLDVTVYLDAPVETDSHSQPEQDDHSTGPVDSHGASDEHTIEEDDHGSSDGNAAEDDAHVKGSTDDHTDPEDAHSASDFITLQKGHGKGEYEGVLNFTRAGGWVIHVMLAEDHEGSAVEFELEVGSTSSKWIILGSFLALNVSILAAAVVFKPKPAAAS